MSALAPLLLLPALLAQAPADTAAAKAVRERLAAIYLDDAESYRIYRDADRKEKVELRREPVYVWTNPVQTNGQDGHVFVWTYKGRAEAIGTVFSTPHAGPRRVVHELHSLSLGTLEVDRPGATGWKPMAPGIELKPLPGAPAPARSAPLRLAQMRAIGRDVSGSAVDWAAKRWELRVLPQPLYRYESTDPDVLDGAVFAMVSSAGTDPEVVFVLEARKAPGQPAPAWQFGGARFSDMGLTVKYKDAIVFEAPWVKWDAPVKDPLHRYHLNVDRTIPAVEDDATAKSPEAAPRP